MADEELAVEQGESRMMQSVKSLGMSVASYFTNNQPGTPGSPRKLETPRDIREGVAYAVLMAAPKQNLEGLLTNLLSTVDFEAQERAAYQKVFPSDFLACSMPCTTEQLRRNEE